MISKTQFARIRRMYFRDGISIHEIARRTGLSRPTVRKWLRAPSGTDIIFRRYSPEKIIKPFEP